jgi:hypothetical protein
VPASFIDRNKEESVMSDSNIIQIASATPSLPVRPRTRRGRNTISARRITLATRGKREQAYWAAGWYRGDLEIVKTLTLAGRIFNVSVAAVRAELTDLEATTELEPAIDALFRRMSQLERDAFVARQSSTIWASFDRNTATATA